MIGLKSLAIAAGIGAVSVAQAPQTPPQPADLTVPAGFTASVFASDLAGARLMTVSPEGTLLVARRPRSEVIALRLDPRTRPDYTVRRARSMSASL